MRVIHSPCMTICSFCILCLGMVKLNWHCGVSLRSVPGSLVCMKWTQAFLKPSLIDSG